MWYIELLKHLAKTICPSEENEAILFVTNLIDLFRNHLYEGQEPEPLFIFGFIVGLYKYSLVNQKNSISLKQFSEHSVGLLILHAKFSDDYALYCEDFVKVISNHIILSSLNLNDELFNLRKDYLDGVRHHESIHSWPSIENINEYITNRLLLNNITLTDVLKRLERETFAKLGYFIDSSLDDMVELLNKYLPQLTDPVSTMESLSHFLEPYKNIESTLDEFIATVDNFLRSCKIGKCHTRASVKCMFIPKIENPLDSEITSKSTVKL